MSSSSQMDCMRSASTRLLSSSWEFHSARWWFRLLVSLWFRRIVSELSLA